MEQQPSEGTNGGQSAGFNFTTTVWLISTLRSKRNAVVSPRGMMLRTLILSRPRVCALARRSPLLRVMRMLFTLTNVREPTCTTLMGHLE